MCLYKLTRTPLHAPSYLCVCVHAAARLLRFCWACMYTHTRTYTLLTHFPHTLSSREHQEGEAGELAPGAVGLVGGQAVWTSVEDAVGADPLADVEVDGEQSVWLMGDGGASTGQDLELDSL